jgi:hypothetical protein
LTALLRARYGEHKAYRATPHNSCL